MRARWLIIIAVGLFAAAVSIDSSWRGVNRWLDRHALTTNLIASAFFALLVSLAINRLSKQRAAERLKVPAREAFQRLAFASRQATASLRELIQTRAAEIDEGATATGPRTDQGSFASLDALQTSRSREVAEAILQIASVEPAWLVTTLAPHAERLADLASERIVAAGPTLELTADPPMHWALEDAGTLRSIAAAARTVASYYAPMTDETVSPVMAAVADAARRELPNLPDDVADAVRKGITAEDEYKELLVEAANNRKLAAVQGVKSIALLIALRENQAAFD